MDKNKIKQILANKAEVIRLKKATAKQFIIGLSGSGSTNLTTKNEDTEDVIKRQIVGNTYLWLDNHDDVHVPGVFTKTIKENQNTIVHLHDHIHEITAKVGEITNVEEKQIAWKDLGIDIEGNTTSLVIESDIIKDYNPLVFNGYKRGTINQHSVGMQYVKMELAANYPDDEAAFKEWEKWYDKLGNKENADELGYFFVVYEAKLIEVSAVINGSNRLTPTLQNETPEKALMTEIKNKFGQFETLDQFCNLFKSLELKPLIDTSKGKPTNKARKYPFIKN